MKYDAKVKYLLNNWKKLTDSEIKAIVRNISSFNFIKYEEVDCELLHKIYVYFNRDEIILMCSHQRLDEKFILDNYRNLDMRYVCAYQQIRYDFALNNLNIFKNYLDLLTTYQYYDKEKIAKLKMLSSLM